ncbi:nadp-dependent alcohol dehydrogenase [Colletotrichum plurivorum]|uniref:alcohol dehydrogenase (NADP(+)) n=1 Tax=Colletotrichum plurivorum TaxID=2175906 RepID=A0A8H6K7B5_9PEZI|nr:nadp-dependent alcohol dehydrogenase [Colletotrichum plurivorum]
MTTDYKFEGWLGRGPESAQGKMEWGSFEPKRWTEDDVDIQITHCGICGSDMHTLRSGWGATDYPCCVGHEIVGRAVRVGANVRHIKAGDRVGVGAQARSCLQPDCPDCSRGAENACVRERIDTYGSKYPNGEGKSFGGYADYNRTNGRFVFKIPDRLSSEAAAPMLCGGITVYAPLKENDCGPGKTVGIIGLGGLGHFGVLFAKALGADRVVGISRRRAKEADALALGADDYIATADDAGWASKHKRTLDIIVCTVSNSDMPLQKYLSLLRWGGSFIQVGAPDGGKLPEISAFSLIMNNIKVGGSNIGSVNQIKEMLEFAEAKNIKPWIQTRPMSDANQAIVDMEDGKARYRYVLVNEKHQ